MNDTTVGWLVGFFYEKQKRQRKMWWNKRLLYILALPCKRRATTMRRKKSPCEKIKRQYNLRKSCSFFAFRQGNQWLYFSLFLPGEGVVLRCLEDIRQASVETCDMKFSERVSEVEKSSSIWEAGGRCHEMYGSVWMNFGEKWDMCYERMRMNSIWQVRKKNVRGVYKRRVDIDLTRRERTVNAAGGELVAKNKKK